MEEICNCPNCKNCQCESCECESCECESCGCGEWNTLIMVSLYIVKNNKYWVLWVNYSLFLYQMNKKVSTEPLHMIFSSSPAK